MILISRLPLPVADVRRRIFRMPAPGSLRAQATGLAGLAGLLS